MSKVNFPTVEVSKLVTLERIRRRRKALPKALVEHGLQTEIERRIARALGGEIRDTDLSEIEQRYVRQVQALVEAG